MEAVRNIITNTGEKISERIKWNAPSYYYNKLDFLTFNPRATKHIHLVFHHPAIIKVPSELLEGEYKDRQMTYFDSGWKCRLKSKNLKEYSENY